MSLPKLTLHSSLQSWSSVCVELLLALTDVPAEREHYDLTPGVWTTRTSSKLRQLNPTRRVPVLLEEGGFVLTESTAIMRFILDSRLAHRQHATSSPVAVPTTTAHSQVATSQHELCNEVVEDASAMDLDLVRVAELRGGLLIAAGGPQALTLQRRHDEVWQDVADVCSKRRNKQECGIRDAVAGVSALSRKSTCHRYGDTALRR